MANGVVYVSSEDGGTYGYDAAGSLGCSASGAAKTCSPLWGRGHRLRQRRIACHRHGVLFINDSGAGQARQLRSVRPRGAEITVEQYRHPAYHRLVISSSHASSADIDFATGAPIDGAEEPVWIHGAASRKQCTDPAKVPLRRTVDELVGAWLAEHPREDYELVVAHTHGHHDHRDGDPQFAGRPHATVVGHTAEEVRSFYGFSEWPGQIVSFDLGGRVLELTATPGHHPASITVYDPWTGFLLTGDTIMPGRLYAKEYADFLQSLERLVEFAARRSITRVLGCHIEMSRAPGHDYPAGSAYQPDEVPLRLPAGRITDIRDAAARAATKPGVYVHGDFIIWNGGQRLAPMLGQAVRLIAHNRANRKQARRRRGAKLGGAGDGRSDPAGPDDRRGHGDVIDSVTSQRVSSPPSGPWSGPLRSGSRRDRGYSSGSRTGAVSAA